jgi:hypothetical protein
MFILSTTFLMLDLMFLEDITVEGGVCTSSSELRG